MSGWFGKDTDWNDARRLETALSALRSTGAGHDPVSLDTNADTVLEIPGEDGDPQQIGLDTQAANTVWAGPTTGADAIPTFRLLVVADIPAHNLLSATHGDTVTNTVARGSLVFGNASALWDELTHPGAGYALTTDANDVWWDLTPIWPGLHTFTATPAIEIDVASGDPVIVFDTAGADRFTVGVDDDDADKFKINSGAALANPSDFELDSNGNVEIGGDFNLLTGKGIIHADGVAAGNILRADGTRYIPADPTLYVPFAPTAQGDMIIADATPAWSRLALAAGAGYALISTATTAEWDQTPIWTDGHQWQSNRNALTALETPTNYHAVLYNPQNDTAEGVGLGFYISTGTNDVGAAIVHRRTDSNSKGTLQFYTKQDTDDASPPTLVLTLGDDGVSTFAGNVDLDNNDLILDTDGDSYLHASGDDVVDLVLAGASGEFAVNINSAEDFTFTANAFNVLAGSDIVMGNGCSIGQAAGPILTFDDTNDLLEITGCKVGLGTTTVPHGGVGAALLALEGTNASTAGPHVQFTTASDDYPLMQVFNWVHDNLGIMFDAYFDGTNSRSSHAGANFFLYKNGSSLQIRCDDTIAPGNIITWNIPLVVTSTRLVAIGDPASSTPNARLHVSQNDSSGGMPVLLLHQVDVDLEFISFTGTAANGDLTRNIVDEGDQASETREGWLKIYVQDDGNQITDQAYFVPVYTLSA